jgi:carboxyl-terminal processing protease
MNTQLILICACALLLAALAGHAQPAPAEVTLKPEEARQRTEAMKGSFGGIGAELAQTNGLLLLKAAIAGGPAARAGLQAGSAILRINGISTSDMALDDAMKLLRGEEGTRVAIELRTAAGHTQQVALLREKIILGKPETAMPAPSVGLVRLTLFNDETATALQSAVRDLQIRGARSLILDLRGAGGGSIASIQRVASLVLPSGAPLWLQEQEDGRRVLARAPTAASVISLRLAVLVDGKTEAAELLAGAIQYNKRGTVIGRKTSGLAAAKAMIKNPDGSSRLVPTGGFLLPSAQRITGVGVMPDKELPANAASAEVISAAVAELESRSPSTP